MPTTKPRASKAKAAAKNNPNAYVPKDPETRICVVCRQPFQTTQPLRVYCSHVGATSCWRKLDTYVRQMGVAFSQACFRQRWACFNCGEVSTGGLLVPVILRPDLVPIIGGVMEHEDIVAGCPTCRSEFYLTLATTVTTGMTLGVATEVEP